MTIRTVVVERVSVVSAKPIEAVVAVLEAAIGHPDMVEFGKTIQTAKTFADFQSAVGSGLGKTGLMMFLKLDHGSVLRKQTGADKPKIVRFIVGNPLIMKDMVRHVPDAGSYAPVTILVDERSEGVSLTYDRMASLLSPYGNAEALAVARQLDQKIESLMQEAALS